MSELQIYSPGWGTGISGKASIESVERPCQQFLLADSFLS